MTDQPSPALQAKQAAGARAAQFVENGMKVGLGTGSTAEWLVRALGARVRAGRLSIKAVPTSRRTADLARSEGIEVVSLDEAGRLDLTIDGADEFDAAFNLVKGGGGALLHEKIVAAASGRMIVIADPSKAVETLGAFPLPLEVISFGRASTQAQIEETLAELDVGTRTTALRMDSGAPYVTDEGNAIIDLHLTRIGKPRQLALALNQVPGVVENGLFVGMCDTVIIGHPDGRVELRDLDTGSAAMEDASDNIFRDLDV